MEWALVAIVGLVFAGLVVSFHTGRTFGHAERDKAFAEAEAVAIKSLRAREVTAHEDFNKVANRLGSDSLADHIGVLWSGGDTRGQRTVEPADGARGSVVGRPASDGIDGDTAIGANNHASGATPGGLARDST